MGACQDNLNHFSKQKKTRVIAGKPLWIEELNFSILFALWFWKLPFPLLFLGFVRLWGGLSFPWCFSLLSVSGAVRFLLLSRKSDKQLLEKAAPRAMPRCSAPANRGYSVVAVILTLFPRKSLPWTLQLLHFEGIERKKNTGGDRQKSKEVKFYSVVKSLLRLVNG